MVLPWRRLIAAVAVLAVTGALGANDNINDFVICSGNIELWANGTRFPWTDWGPFVSWGKPNYVDAGSACSLRLSMTLGPSMPWLSAGGLITCSGGAVYKNENGFRRAFPDQASLDAALSSATATTIDCRILDALPRGPDVGAAYNTSALSGYYQCAPNIMLLGGGKRFLFPRMEYVSWRQPGYRAYDSTSSLCSAINAMPAGPDMPSLYEAGPAPMNIVRCKDTTTKWVIRVSTKYPFPPARSPPDAHAQTLDCDQLAAVPEGPEESTVKCYGSDRAIYSIAPPNSQGYSCSDVAPGGLCSSWGCSWSYEARGDLGLICQDNPSSYYGTWARINASADCWRPPRCDAAPDASLAPAGSTGGYREFSSCSDKQQNETCSTRCAAGTVANGDLRVVCTLNPEGTAASWRRVNATASCAASSITISGVGCPDAPDRIFTSLPKSGAIPSGTYRLPAGTTMLNGTLEIADGTVCIMGAAGTRASDVVIGQLRGYVRHFRVSGTAPQLALAGVTLQGPSAPLWGGGISIAQDSSAGRLGVHDTRFVSLQRRAVWTHSYGGAIFINGRSTEAVISASTFTNCSAPSPSNSWVRGYGGSIAMWSSGGYGVTDVDQTDSSSDGGGVAMSATVPHGKPADAERRANSTTAAPARTRSAAAAGGAVSTLGASGGNMANPPAAPALTITGCTFTGSRASRGGALLLSSTDFVVRNCSFTGNSANERASVDVNEIAGRQFWSNAVSRRLGNTKE